jgi:hypothetical protein
VGWKSLFYLYLIVIVLVIVGALVPPNWTVRFLGEDRDLLAPALGLFFAIVSIALIRTLTIVDGIGALQDLRSKLLIAAAEKRDREERLKASGEIEFHPGPVDPGFGRKIAFPR